MFKNSVFKTNVNTKKWFINAGIRAVKTAAQTALSLFTIGQLLDEVSWITILSASAVAAVYSILTSIAGIPEVESE